jgi:hypothetical protein
MRVKLLLAAQIFMTLLSGAPLLAQNTVTDWNGIASSTMVARGGKSSATRRQRSLLLTECSSTISLGNR